MSGALDILMKLSPSAMYTATDLVNAMLRILDAAESKESAVRAANMLAALDVKTLSKVISDDLLPTVINTVQEIVKSGGVKDEEIIAALRAVLPESEPDNLKQMLINKIHEIKER